MSLNEPQSRYEQVADRIRERIEAGTYPRGSVLPSQPDLAAEFGINQTSVGKAIAMLRAEGLVRVVKGVRSHVREIPPIPRNASVRYSHHHREDEDGRGAFDAELKRLGLTPHSEVPVIDRVVPPTDVAKALQLPEGEPNALVRMRRMYANDIPVQIAPSYIPWSIAEGTALAERDSGPGGIISRFAELGHAQKRITESIAVRPPSKEEQDFLELSQDQRVYHVTHIGWTADDRPVEVCLHIMPTHQWTLNYEWPLE